MEQESRRRVADPNRIRVWVEHPTGVSLVMNDDYIVSSDLVMDPDGIWDGTHILCSGRVWLGVRREMAYLLGEDPDGI
jgi:hypothetical protein